jgi:hypothetical protein
MTSFEWMPIRYRNVIAVLKNLTDPAYTFACDTRFVHWQSRYTGSVWLA